MSEQTPTTIALEAADSSPHTGETVALGRELVPVPANSLAPVCTPVEINFHGEICTGRGRSFRLADLTGGLEHRRRAALYLQTDGREARAQGDIEARTKRGCEINPRRSNLIVHRQARRASGRDRRA